MTEYNKIMDGYFTSIGVAKTLNLPCVPDTIEFWNLTKWGTNTNHLVQVAYGYSDQAAGTAYCTVETGDTELDNAKITSGGFTFFSAGTPTFGAVQAMSTTFVTQANPANVTVTGHGYSTGDVVWIYGTTGMLQIAGVPYVITKVDANNFTIPVNSSGFAAAATAGNVKKFNFPDLYIPNACVITNVTQASSAVITTSVNHNFFVGQEVGFVFPSVQGSTSTWGMFQMDTETYLKTNGVPQQAMVTAVTANTLTVNINSTDFTAFAYPTSANAALGMTFPQVFAIGDQNSGATNSSFPIPAPIDIPGSFVANTRQGVVIGIGDGTTLMHQTSDVCRWRAIFPDQLQTS